MYGGNEYGAVEYGGENSADGSLVAVVGHYLIAGYSATITIRNKLALTSGAYLISGKNIILTIAKKIGITTGHYLYTGYKVLFDKILCIWREGTPHATTVYEDECLIATTVYEDECLLATTVYEDETPINKCK